MFKIRKIVKKYVFVKTLKEITAIQTFIPFRVKVASLKRGSNLQLSNFKQIFLYILFSVYQRLATSVQPLKEKKVCKIDLRNCPRTVYSRIISAQYIIPERQRRQGRQNWELRLSQRHLSGNKLSIQKKDDKILGKKFRF